MTKRSVKGTVIDSLFFADVRSNRLQNSARAGRTGIEPVQSGSIFSKDLSKVSLGVTKVSESVYAQPH